MGDAAISFVVDHLGKLLLNEVALQRGVRTKVEWLKEELLWMESFLVDAKSKGEGGDELAKTWVKDVMKIAYRAEDVLDNHMLQMKLPQLKRSQLLLEDGGFMGSVKRYLICFSSCPQILIARRTFSNEIQDIKSKIGDIKTRRETYNPTRREMNDVVAKDEEAMQARRRISPRLIDDAVIVGFDAHETMIVERLVDDKHIKGREVLSIVGAGGIGKSTLAKKVYNNTKISAHFDARGWASVSEDFNPILLLKKITKEVIGSVSHDEEDGEIDLKVKLQDHLEDKKYFIVLDDIWNEEVWDRVRGAFPDTNKGSRVLITTRSKKVATSACSLTQIFELPVLNDQQSWNLFTAIVFVKENEDRTRGDGSCPPELEPVAWQLVNKCGGLPLALVVLARLLSKQDMSLIRWKSFADNLEWANTAGGMTCMDILRLSYKHLRHRHLRSCFLYLGCFPEDEEISGVEVTWLWIAEGFIPDKHNQTFEETAEEYLKELAQMSMIQVVNKETDGRVKEFKIHDLFREMCLKEAAKDGFLGVLGACEDDDSKAKLDYQLVRRLAIPNELTEEAGKGLTTRLNIRSLLAFNGITAKVLDGLRGQRLLRVLSLMHASFRLFYPGEIKSMIYLRYLKITSGYLSTVTSSMISNLQNLLTLDLYYTGVEQLPDSIGKLKMLRHLLVPEGCRCPPTICYLTNLQSLTSPGTRGGWIEENCVDELSKLRTLEISDICNGQEEEALLQSIDKLEHLSHFSVFNGKDRTLSTNFITAFSNRTFICKLNLWGPLSLKQLPTSNEFPAYLGQLVLAYSGLEEDPMPILGRLPNLTYLELKYKAYIGKEMVCCENGFPQLQELVMIYLEDLEQWTVQVGAMPKLQSLALYRCEMLVMLPEGLQHVTSLRQLEVTDHRDGFRDRLLEDDGLDWHKIKHVRNIYIYGGRH